MSEKSEYEGRFVNPCTSWGKSGFLHWWEDRDAWYVTPGWEHFCAAAWELRPGVTFDNDGIIACGEAVYEWADDPNRMCSRGCPACYRDKEGTPWSCLRCALNSWLHGIAPGQHYCVISPATAVTILPREQSRMIEAQAAAQEAIQERDRLEQMVEMLTSIVSGGAR